MYRYIFYPSYASNLRSNGVNNVKILMIEWSETELN